MADSISFDRAADFYDETRGFPSGVETPVMALIAQAGDLTPENRILEIGIGTGRIALPLARFTGARVYGGDISMGMMARLLAKRADEVVHPTQADAAALPFASRTFDRVIVSHVFHLVHDVDTVLNELARTLKPDGRLLHCWHTNDQTLAGARQAAASVIQSEARRTTNWRRGFNALDENGWVQQGAPLTMRYVTREKPSRLLEQYRSRCWSSTWYISDEDIDRGYEAMHTYLTDTYGTLDAPIEVDHVYSVAVYTPPSAHS
ncbi:MAG: class I SAM-dependent methyltransferase [Chloroflexota bacterium]